MNTDKSDNVQMCKPIKLLLKNRYYNALTLMQAKSGLKLIKLLYRLVHTHYHNSYLIWRTVSRRMDEITQDAKRRGSSNGMASATYRDTVHQIELQ